MNWRLMILLSSLAFLVGTVGENHLWRTSAPPPDRLAQYSCAHAITTGQYHKARHCS